MARVFISHRTTDMSEAICLANAIRNAGHDVWLDDWELAPGDSVIEEIQAGLSGAEYVVLCLSSHGIMSNWISREWMSTLARQLDSESVRLLPVRLTGGSLPEIMRDIKYADLVTDWSNGLKDLLRAIQ